MYVPDYSSMTDQEFCGQIHLYFPAKSGAILDMTLGATVPGKQLLTERIVL